ncbi:MAG: anaerobic ribonucleoside-triphosphate reductase activating protein [Clostridia bacterium]|nr:anaerobic ribonucleoside-triphosphate reductase activating protein [Clostridia bacterium]NCC42504.1 anaerobic ribonucleoside-triphosphate reductase activating protein [Clostridia bacterium]
MVKIHGFNKLTLLDYPGRLACTIFLGHCNFRCPFCHNAGLVLSPDKEPVIPMEEVLGTLKKRKGILEGVCITGGEPTMSAGLPDFIRKIKELGYAVKLDTNGTHPEMLRRMIEAGMIDYVAMDIKNSPEKYSETSGVREVDIDAINESINLLKSGIIDYEFRTTVVKELHKKEDIEKIGKWLSGSRRYFLQAYKESEQVIRPVYSSYSREQLENYRQMLLEEIPQVEIRGI